MVFSSMTFLWIFFPILLGIYFISKEKYRNIILLFFSLIFYSWGETRYIMLMLFSIIINYVLGIILNKLETKNKKRIILIISVLFNLGLLGYFKYFNFFATNINKLLGTTLIQIKDIVLPIYSFVL